MIDPSPERRSKLLPLDTDHLFAGVAFAAIFAMSIRVDVQNDTWWLLRTGKEIVRTHRPVTTELWSSTSRGRDWPNHETLSELVFYLLHRIGGVPLLAAFCAVLLTASWYLVYRTCVGPARFRVLAVLLGAYTQAANYGLRPLLFTMVFFAVALRLVLDRDRDHHWWLPPLFLVWANTHGGVSFGGLLLVVACVVAWFTEPDRRRHWLAVTVTSGLATLVNPLGFGLWQLVFHTFDNPFLRVTNEWKALSIHGGNDLRIVGLAGFAAIALALTVRTWRGLQDWLVAILTIILGVLSFRAVRNSAMFAPVAAIAIARLFRDRRPSHAPDRSLARLHLVAFVAIVAALVLVTAPNLPTDDNSRPLSPTVAAAVERCDGPLFTTFNNGGVLLWWLPDQPVFVDNRQDPYSQDLLFDALHASIDGDYERLFAEWDIQCAFVENDATLTGVLRRDGWRVSASDEEFTVLVRQSTAA